MIEKGKLSIVIPVYNSEKIISQVVNEIVDRYNSDYALEIILVNDGSIDNSSCVCLALSESYPQVKYLEFSKNFGQHNAVLAGLKQSNGDLVVTMDDDMQHPPAEVKKLLDEMNKDYDVVYGNYYGKNHDFFRNIGTSINNLMARVLIDRPQQIELTSFRIMKKYIVDEITNYSAPYPYIDGLILRTTHNIGKVYVNHDKRLLGESSYTFGKLLGLWLNGFFNFSIIPLRVCSWGGVVIAATGFIFAAYFIFEKVINPSIVLGWTSLITAIVIFSGIQLIAIGMLGEYVGRMFLTQNRTPPYVIKRHVQGGEIK